MSKPVGYFNLSENNQLIADMTEEWGSDLARMSKADCLFLISEISAQMLEGTNGIHETSTSVFQVVDRLNELEDWQKIALIRALVQEA